MFPDPVGIEKLSERKVKLVRLMAAVAVVSVIVQIKNQHDYSIQFILITIDWACTTGKPYRESGRLHMTR